MGATVVFLILMSTVCLLSSCRSNRNFSRAEKKIPGIYRYDHSWDYKDPDGNGTIHCDEHGSLVFNADGTYVDNAIQYHSLTMKDSIRVPNGFDGDSITIGGAGFQYIYHCQGRWKVENGKFLFNEMSEDFSMGSIENIIWSSWWLEYSAKIVKHSWPNSERWFTFDFERLDNEWFIWSYTYPNGRKDTWDMERVKPGESYFGQP